MSGTTSAIVQAVDGFVVIWQAVSPIFTAVLPYLGIGIFFGGLALLIRG